MPARPVSDSSFGSRGSGGLDRVDAQEAASHADPRTTMRSGRARGSLDWHATYIVAAYLVGASRLKLATWQELRLAAPRTARRSRASDAGTEHDPDSEERLPPLPAAMVIGVPKLSCARRIVLELPSAPPAPAAIT
jgi:hypothetical protein